MCPTQCKMNLGTNVCLTTDMSVRFDRVHALSFGRMLGTTVPPSLRPVSRRGKLLDDEDKSIWIPGDLCYALSDYPMRAQLVGSAMHDP